MCRRSNCAVHSGRPVVRRHRAANTRGQRDTHDAGRERRRTGGVDEERGTSADADHAARLSAPGPPARDTRAGTGSRPARQCRSLALAWFKLRLAPHNYLFTPTAITGLRDRLLDGSRWTLIWAQVTDRLPTWGELPGGGLLILILAVALTLRVNRRAAERCGFGLAVIALMMIGYLLVYAITPLPLQWQISTSFSRLVTQLWPALVWALFQLSGAGMREPELVTVSEGSSVHDIGGRLSRLRSAGRIESR